MNEYSIEKPASQFRGLSATGLDNKTWMAKHTLYDTPETQMRTWRVHTGVHLDFKIFKHTSPVEKWILGWKIWVTNLALGACKG